MTKTRLRQNVIAVMLAFASLFVVAVGAKRLFGSVETYTEIKDFSSLFVATGAAYLAFCFQRRQAFLVSLRELWKDLVEAKGDLIDYTHLAAPDQAAFGKTHRSLSKVIDGMRGVYRNVGETRQAIGLYPFEPLHDMRRELETLGWVGTTPAQQGAARARIKDAWMALRWSFLDEFSTPEPRHPILTRGATDPRRGRYPASPA